MIKRRANAITIRVNRALRVVGMLNTTKSYTNVLKYTYILAFLFMLSGFMFNLTEPQTFFKVQFGRLMSWESFLLDHIAGVCLYLFSLAGLWGFANSSYNVTVRFAMFSLVAVVWFLLFVHFDPRF